MLDAILLIIGIFVIHEIYEYFKRKPLLKHNNKRYILITGCDTGFGNAAAKKLDSMGCHVFAACYTIQGAKSLKEAASSRLKTLQLDVTNEKSIKEAYDFISHELSRTGALGLWGLVNNAGVAAKADAPVEYLHRTDFSDVLDVNLLGTIHMCNTFLPLLKLSKGRIVNTSSAAGRNWNPLNIPYVISKAGVEAFSDGFRCYVQRYGIKVAIIEPGFFTTDIHADDKIHDRAAKGYERLPDDCKKNVPTSDYIKQSMKYIQKFKRYDNKNVDLVADAYVNGLLAVEPKKRYSVGRDAYWVWIPISYLPTCVQDFINTRLDSDHFGEQRALIEKN